MDDPAVEVLRLVASGARGRAAELAASSPGALCAALAGYLNNNATAAVYDDAYAFQSFISNGTNPALYDNTIAGIGALQRREQPRAVLDIGCGDGRVSAASLSPSVTRLDLVEPGRSMLDEAIARVGEGVEVAGHNNTIEQFLATTDRRWDVVQSTFAMHNLPPDVRGTVWADLAQRTHTLAICEFDVPDFADRSDAHCSYLAQRYALGIDEYADHPEVIHGFLMPVLVGQVEPDAVRYTFEQPIDRWVDELEDAGFTVSRQLVMRYWWADAWLLIGAAPQQPLSRRPAAW